jgi:integrase
MSPRGDGITVKQVAEGVHEFRWTELVNGKRKWRRKKVNCTPEEAVQHKIIAMEATGRTMKAEKTFADLCDAYLKTDTWQKAYSDKAQKAKAIKAKFGDTPLSAFGVQMLEAYQSELLTTPFTTRGGNKKQRSPATVNRYLVILKHMFAKADTWGWIDGRITKAVKGIKLLPEPNVIVRYLSDDEDAALFRQLRKTRAVSLLQIVEIALNTGMRQGEIMGLTWDNVDLKNGVVYLAGETTKTKTMRQVMLNAGAIAAFNSLPRRIDGGKVFKARKFDHDSWEHLVRRAGIRDFRFHDLRHTFASRLVMAGVPIYTVAKLLGHSTVATTQRYAHLAPGAMRDAVAVLDKPAFVSLSRSEGVK